MLLIKKQRVRILRIMKFIPTRMSTLINWALFEHNFNTIGQGWAINFPKGPHEIVGLLWRAGPIG